MDIEVLPSFMERFDGGKSPPFAERTPSASPQSLELLAKAVTRHLEDLLNSRTHLDPRDLEAYPAFANSVLNYGNRDFCGTDPNAMDDGVIDQMKEAITRFEPRINPKTLAVRKVRPETGSDAIRFEVQAEIWASPTPKGLKFTAELDLGTGWYRVS